MNVRRTLSTASYAMLGLLAVRPWSAYELTGQIRRSLRWCLPKSESLLYTEPKRLVAMGLATVSRERAGLRTRAVYRITPRGRATLRAWLASRPAAPQLEAEVMLRVSFADQAGTRELLDALRASGEDAERLLAEGVEQVRGYLADGGPFPERLHLLGLMVDFYKDYALLLRDWSARAEAEVASWPRSGGLGMTAAARRSFEAADLAARALGQHGGPAARDPGAAG
jgi:DNA-binding PadR family transcriptional regulator